jgi:hypothetical protein
MELPYCSQPEAGDSTDIANSLRSLTVAISTGGRNERDFSTLLIFMKKLGLKPRPFRTALLDFTTALGLFNLVYFCNVLSMGQLPSQISQPCTHSDLLPK